MSKKQFGKAVSVGLGLGAVAWLSQTTRANIIGSYVNNGDGTITYSYVVDNTSGPFYISAWSLDFAFPVPDWNQLDIASGGQVQVPDLNWFANIGIPSSGLSAQDFLSLSPAGDVPIGQTLSGFSFTSRYLPASVAYLEFSMDGVSLQGVTTGPGVLSVPDAGGKFAEFAFTAAFLFAATGRVVRARA